MAINQSFSKRNRYGGAAPEITSRETAPHGLRYALLQTALDLDWAPSSLRSIICKVLRVAPNPSNWSEYPNIWSEVESLIYSCEWFKVYDVIEAIHAHLQKHDMRNGQRDAEQFTEEINSYFLDEGIGWQLTDGQIVTRGSEVFESVLHDAAVLLDEQSRPTAAGHLREALLDLSRRPDPDLAGAIYHAMGSLECLARDVVGDANATLGEILKVHPRLLPKPLDTAMSQIWGFASNVARHVKEGNEPNRDETELIVGLCASIVTYVTRKAS